MFKILNEEDDTFEFLGASEEKLNQKGVELVAELMEKVAKRERF